MRKKIVSLIMTVVLIVSVYFLVKTVATYTMSKHTENETKVVVIDAGHGGNDPGKVGINGALEKDINLKIAMTVKGFLEANDIKVIMTREEDKGLYKEGDSNKKAADIKKRVEIMETPGVALAVSIHQNSYGSEDVTGSQVFYYTHSEQGKRIAEIMQKQLVEGIDFQNHRKPKGNESYYILKKCQTPSVIVECGFLSSPVEAELLCDELYQEKMAWNIHMAIIKYLNEM